MPMVRREALDASVRSLLQACAAAALLSLPGCGKEASVDGTGDEYEDSSECGGGWDPAVDVELMTSGTIVSLLRVGPESVALLQEGALVNFDGWGTESSATIPAMGLRAWIPVANDAQLVVGDGGQILRSAPGGGEWAVIDAGITDDLIDAVASADGTWALAIASGRVLYTNDAGMTWTPLAAPDGEWTGLRRVLRAAGRIWLIGDGGQVWSSSDPSSGWEAVALGTTEDLLDGSEPLACPSCVALVSATTMHILVSDEWASLPAPEGEVFIAARDGYVVTDQAVYTLAPTEGTLSKVQDLEFTPTMVAGDWENIFVAGSGGELVRISLWYCLGRPWVIGGVPTTAALVGPNCEPSSTWARDGLYEHASVASFARFVTELLALGAPPALIQAAQSAILDELEHARLCFELAAREPGPLPLRRLHEQGGVQPDPVALALAVFEEGCIGEGVAAIRAGVAAAEAEDPDARRVLEQIAVDERRHAALAWRTLRWLLDEFGAPVRLALQERARNVPATVRPLTKALLDVPTTALRC
jgi:hypothetical protein